MLKESLYGDEIGQCVVQLGYCVKVPLKRYRKAFTGKEGDCFSVPFGLGVAMNSGIISPTNKKGSFLQRIRACVVRHGCQAWLKMKNESIIVEIYFKRLKS